MTQCAGAHARLLATSAQCVDKSRQFLDGDTRAPRSTHIVARKTRRTVPTGTQCACAGKLTGPQRRQFREESRLIRAARAQISPNCTVLVATLALTRSKHALAGPKHRSSGAIRRLIGAKGTWAGEKWTPMSAKRARAAANRSSTPRAAPQWNLHPTQSRPLKSCTAM